jgi:hypothetical protein
MTLITGLLCLAMAGMMILCGHLLNRISHLEDLLKSMNDDLNMVSKTMENMHKHEKAKELSKQILKG